MFSYFLLMPFFIVPSLFSNSPAIRWLKFSICLQKNGGARYLLYTRIIVNCSQLMIILLKLNCKKTSNRTSLRNATNDLWMSKKDFVNNFRSLYSYTATVVHGILNTMIATVGLMQEGVDNEFKLICIYCNFKAPLFENR